MPLGLLRTFLITDPLILLSTAVMGTVSMVASMFDASGKPAFNNEKVDNLMAALEEVLPERKSSGKPAKPDVLQI